MLLRCTQTWWAATRGVQSADARAPPPTVHRCRKPLLPMLDHFLPVNTQPC